jgi:Golgin subfamily A member 7/ERF4 family
MHQINAIFSAAERWGAYSCMESLLGCASFYTIWFCCDANYDKQMARLERLLEHENENVYRPKRVEFLSPLLNGLLHVEIVDLSSVSKVDGNRTHRDDNDDDDNDDDDDE